MVTLLISMKVIKKEDWNYVKLSLTFKVKRLTVKKGGCCD